MYKIQRWPFVGAALLGLVACTERGSELPANKQTSLGRYLQFMEAAPERKRFLSGLTK